MFQPDIACGAAARSAKRQLQKVRWFGTKTPGTYIFLKFQYSNLIKKLFCLWSQKDFSRVMVRKPRRFLRWKRRSDAVFSPLPLGDSYYLFRQIFKDTDDN